MKPIRNLVLEGGGVKGVAYIGVGDVLEQNGVMSDLRRVAGTSAGAINAMLISVGYDVKEVSEIMWNLNFEDFADNDLGILRDAHRFMSSFGWHKGDHFLEWAKKAVERKTGNPNLTFKELHELVKKEPGKYKDLYTIGTNLSTRSAEVFSYESKHKDIPIALAVRISMSIPLFFAAVHLNGDVYVDGGVQNNFPIRIFDKARYADEFCVDPNEPIFNEQTLGVRLDTEDELDKFHHGKPKRSEIDNLYSYATALINSVVNANVNEHFMGNDRSRTIYCNTYDISTIDFNISKINKLRLITSGGNAAANFFSKRKEELKKEAKRNNEVKEEAEPYSEKEEIMDIINGNIRRNMLIKYAMEKEGTTDIMAEEIKPKIFTNKA